jgi:hypothetical protein
MRHSYVSLLGDADVEEAVVSRMVEHSSVALAYNT